MTAVHGKSIQPLLRAASPSCKGCGHPLSPTSVWTFLRTTRNTMEKTARDGCLICSILKEGVERCVAENQTLKSDEFLIQFTTSGMKTMLVRLLGTHGIVSFFVKESKCFTLTTLHPTRHLGCSPEISILIFLRILNLLEP